MFPSSRRGSDWGDAFKVKLDKIENSLYKRYFRISVSFHYLDTSRGKTIRYGDRDVQFNLKKWQTMGSLLWFGVPYRKKKDLGLTSLNTKCDRRDFQKSSSVLCVPEPSVVCRRQHFSTMWCFSALLRFYASVLGAIVPHPSNRGRWLRFMVSSHPGLDDLRLHTMGIFEIHCILWESQHNFGAKEKYHTGSCLYWRR